MNIKLNYNPTGNKKPILKGFEGTPKEFMKLKKMDFIDQDEIMGEFEGTPEEFKELKKLMEEKNE